MSRKRVHLIIRKCLNKPPCNYTQLHVQYIFKLLTIQHRSVCWYSRGLSLSSNHYRQITHESPSGGFRNHNSKAIWKMAKPLYICSVCVCMCVSARPLGTLWCRFGWLPSFWCPYRLPGLHGQVQACFPLQVDTDAVLRGQPEALNTYKHGNTIVSPWFKQPARS